MLTATAAVIALVAMVANWWSRMVSHDRVEVLSKPLATVAIGVFGLSLADAAPGGATVAGAIGLLCCLIGDIALLPAVDRFVIGLGAFLMGHIAFVVMFAALGLPAWGLGAAALLAVVLMAATVGRRIVAGARQMAHALAVPVMAYLTVISTMAVAGWATGRWAAVAGTTLFVVSDAVLGWRRFVDERRWMAPAVMVTYHGALIGVVLSLATTSLPVTVAGASATTTVPGLTAPGTTTTLVDTTTPAATTPATTAPATTVPATTSAPSTVPTSTVPASTVPASTVPASTVPASTVPATAPASTVPATAPPPPPTTASPPIEQGESYPWLAASAAGLDGGNLAVAVSVWRDGDIVFRHGSGAQLDGSPVSGATPFVVASVSKLFTSLAVARLVEAGRLDVRQPVPWDAMGIAHDPAWSDVTVRELLDHTSGMPVARRQWLDLPGPCSVPLVEVLAAPPTDERGEWRYSNGNYCALGLVIEHLTGQPLDAATASLVFAPAGVMGPTLSTLGTRSDMAPYPKGVERLDRLGGAGAWLASTDAVAAVLASVTDADRATMQYPAVMTDQYGWGHTGTVDGAKACAWRFTDGVVLAATVSGNTPSTGGGLCDRLVTALALDLGLLLGEPARLPR